MDIYNQRISKYKKICCDVLLNIFATGASLIVLEVFIYPLIARKLNSDIYGQMQTIVSLEYLIGATLGQALSTTRLVRQSEYERKNIQGDFPILAIVSIIMAVTITFFCLMFYFGLNGLDPNSYLLILLFSILICGENYVEVGLRIELNYQKILKCRCLSCVGYIIGFAVFCQCGYWEFVFIFSFLIQLVYCIKTTKIVKENIQRTALLKTTTIEYFALTISTVLSKTLTYVDKLMLYPLLGGNTVSIYFTATLMGKLVLKALEPINNVILSYMSKKTKINRNLWMTALIVGVTFCIIAYIVCIEISKPILSIFYPQWVDQAMPLVPITTMVLCISALTSILYPFSLKILNMIYQCFINGICLLSYILLLFPLVNRYGVLGSCLALLFSYSIKLIIMIFLCFKNVSVTITKSEMK
ncbi:hypothetical protein [Mordavella massiliensis]|uniref:hypothetical protein n=1 Tax=Mordavella massiliensis TaxID=1871024 RepID=UPI00210EB452|nr:hypothetical protein [Mordavella massiliensis]